MWQERQTELLRDEIEVLLAPLSTREGLSNLVKESMTRGRRGLAAESVAQDKPWSLLPLMVCEAISGHCEQAIPVAAAIQLFTAAADVFDDVEDSDSSESLPAKHGSAVATNVATALLFLAEKAITRLRERGIADSTVVRVMEVVNSYYTIACTGQHMDILEASDAATSEAQYLKIIEMKTASQIECACHTGALLATKKQKLIDVSSMFGQNLGMAAQIANDIQGIMSGTDIMKHKITLPIIFALSQADGEARGRLEGIFLERTAAIYDPAPVRDLLFRTGAIHYATVKMEFYKQLASGALSEAARAGASVERLRLFLE